MKDHEIAKLHNDLRDTALKYKDAQQLRARLVSVVAPLITKLKRVSGIDVKIIKDNLCVYDKRSPYFDKEFNEKKGNCFCDNCFYGRTPMAELLLELME